MSRKNLFFQVIGLWTSIVLCLVPPLATVLLSSMPLRAAPPSVPPSVPRHDLQAQTGKIVFTSTRDGNHNIYVMNADGSNQLPLTNHPTQDDQPVWSPDGTKIAFASLRDADWEVYVMNADGSNQTRISNSPGTDFLPEWSPDGSKIAFTSGRDSSLEIYVMNADGSNQVRLTNNDVEDQLPTWSPDGSKIAFASFRANNYDVYVMNPDGSNQVAITDNPGVDYRPAWSPDGSKIAFASSRDGNFEIYVMNADGSSQVRLTDDPAADHRPVWSEDGSQIAFHSERSNGGDIYVMGTDGSNQVALTTNAALDNNPGWWTPVYAPPIIGELYPPLVHAKIPAGPKVTLDTEPNSGYAGQQIMLSGILPNAQSKALLSVVTRGQTLTTQVIAAQPNGTYNYAYTIPDNASTGKLEICAAVAGVVNAEYSCADIQVGAAPGATVSGILPEGIAGKTQINLTNAAGEVLYAVSVKSDKTFVIPGVQPGFYNTTISGEVLGNLGNSKAYVSSKKNLVDVPIASLDTMKCFNSVGLTGNIEASPSRTGFETNQQVAAQISGIRLEPVYEPNLPFGIYVSGIPANVHFRAAPQVTGAIEKVVFELRNINSQVVATSAPDFSAPYEADFNVGLLAPSRNGVHPSIKAIPFVNGQQQCPASRNLEVIANPFILDGFRPNSMSWNGAGYNINVIFPRILIDGEDLLPVDFEFLPPPLPEFPFYGRFDNSFDAYVQLQGSMQLNGTVNLAIVRAFAYAKVMDNVIFDENRHLMTLNAKTQLNASASTIDLRRVGFDLPPFPLIQTKLNLVAIKAPIVSIAIVTIYLNADFSLNIDLLLRGHIKPLAPEVTVTLDPKMDAVLTAGFSGKILLVEAGVEGRASGNMSAPMSLQLTPDPHLFLEACANLRFDVAGYVIIGLLFYDKRINIAPTNLFNHSGCSRVIENASVSAESPTDTIPELFASPVIAIAEDGTQLSAYVENRAGEGETPKIQVLARFKAPGTEEWGQPVALSDPLHSSRSPAAAFAGADGTPIVAWVETTLTLAQEEALGDQFSPEMVNAHLVRQEIVFSKWDGNAWGTPEFLTDDDMADGLPAMAGSEDGAFLAWARDTDGNALTQADQRIAVSLYDVESGEFSAPELLSAGGGLNSDVAVTYDKSVSPPQPYVIWIYDADAELSTATDRTLAAATHNGSEWVMLNMTGLPAYVDSPAISAGADGVQIAYLARQATEDGSVPIFGTNGAVWTARYQDGSWTPEAVLDENNLQVYGEHPILAREDDEAILVFRRFETQRDNSVLGQIAFNQLLEGKELAAPLYLTDDPIQNWLPTAAISPLNGQAVILKVARVASVSAAANSGLDSIAATRSIMAAQTTTLSAGGDAVEVLTVATTGDPALDPLQVSTAAPEPDQDVTVTVRVRNVGRGTSGDVTLSLYEGTPGAGNLVDSVVVPNNLAFNETFEAEFAVTGSGGEQPLYAELTTGGENSSSANDQVTKVLGQLSMPLMAQVVASDYFIGGLQVDWSGAPEESVTGFRILRGASAAGPFELVGEASVPTFTDVMVQPGENYCYTVQSYNANTFSEQSPALCGQVPMFGLFLPLVVDR